MYCVHKGHQEGMVGVESNTFFQISSAIRSFEVTIGLLDMNA